LVRAASSVDRKRVSLRRLRALLRFPASNRGEALEPISAADQTESIQNELGEFCALNTFRQDGGHVFEITALEGRQCLRRSQMTVQPISLLGRTFRLVSISKISSYNSKK